MWIFGHLGIGSQMAAPFSKRLPWGWLLIGTLVPDMIDKPLYYGLHFATGLSSSDLGLISCTRTIGHSGLLLILISVLAYFKKFRSLGSVALGMGTHLILDGLQDVWFLSHGYPGPSATLWAVAFPYFGRFAAMPFDNLHDHLKTGSQPIVVIGEIVGILFLAFDFWRRKITQRIR